MMRRLRSERGWALVTALLVMTAITSAGLATYSVIDTQTQQSGRERGRDATFNYAEGVLNAETFLLTSLWSQSTAVPDCTYSAGVVTASNGQTAQCPSAATLALVFNGVDYQRGVTWTTKVRDDGGTDPCQTQVTTSTCGYYYSESGSGSTLLQPSYDANKDGQVWVRAQTVVNNVRRTMVARVSTQKVSLSFPHAVVTAGQYTMNNGRWATTNTNGTQVQVRCTTPGTPNSCVHLKSSDQIQPPTAITTAQSAPALSTGDLQQLRDRAKSEGGWYSTCPTSNPTTSLVFIESGACGVSAMPLNTTQATPATVIIVNGSLTIAGASSTLRDFWGVIYLANQQNSTATLFSATGNHNFHGSINVDGQGGVNVGTSSNTSLSYDGGAFNGLYGYGQATIVRPSFREVVSSTP